ncbi:hypothetical protein SEA_GARDENSTATE_60 [Microbacterium phage GardenState]|uniref:Uncharacterized protein n=1 Tax=Microbacterium phage GardenState TaxID=2776841 RepID=A0A7L8ZDZ5_9CAUD|nr:hypothetical protein SEA_GARDENSTATE_60 [Microbacterium phage GardenState]
MIDNVLVEEAARDHVHELRTAPPEPVTLGTSQHLVGPALASLEAAIANLLELSVDLLGGVDGVTMTYKLLQAESERLPGGCFFQHPLREALQVAELSGDPRPLYLDSPTT